MKISLYFHGFIHDLQKISVNSFSNVHENVNENHMKMKKFHIKEILSIGADSLHISSYCVQNGFLVLDDSLYRLFYFS